MHKVCTFDLYDVPKLSDSTHKVNLVTNEKDMSIIAADISFQNLYQNYVKPGKMLYLASEINKKTAQSFEKLKELNVPAEVRNYAILEAESTSANTKKVQVGELKRIHMNLASPIAYYKLCLDRAYQFIAGGAPVEFHIRMKGTYVGKEKIMAGPPDVWPWMHNHFPHLRPDFILKAMPKDSVYMIKPVCDGKQVEFIITRPTPQLPKGDLTKRLMAVKNAVKQAIRGNAPIQLPRGVRERLIETWDKEDKDKDKKSGGAKRWEYSGRDVGKYEQAEENNSRHTGKGLDGGAQRDDGKQAALEEPERQ